MSEETKNTAELTDEQLEKVAGGEGGDNYSFIVTNTKGANVFPGKIEDRRRGVYPYAKVLNNCTKSGDWVFVPFANGICSGYVKMSDLEEF